MSCISEPGNQGLSDWWQALFNKILVSSDSTFTSWKKSSVIPVFLKDPSVLLKGLGKTPAVVSDKDTHFHKENPEKEGRSFFILTYQGPTGLHLLLFGFLHQIPLVFLKMFLDHIQDPKLEEESVKTDLVTLAFLSFCWGNRSGIWRTVLNFSSDLPVIVLSYLTLTSALEIPLITCKSDNI